MRGLRWTETTHMDEAAIAAHIVRTYPDVCAMDAWGETSFFYNPGRKLPRGVYLATLKNKDGDNDRASCLDRPAVFRFNLGVSKQTYRSLFGPPPARPVAGGVVHTGHNFAELGQWVPHPVYAWMSWVCVLNPSAATFARAMPWLDEAHGLTAAKFNKRVLG